MSLEHIRKHIVQDPFARFLGIELLDLREGHGKMALNVSINFRAAVEIGTRLIAEAAEEHVGGRTGLYRPAVTQEDGALIALAHGTAYRRKQPLVV